MAPSLRRLVESMLNLTRGLFVKLGFARLNAALV